MTYVITEACIGVKDRACVDVCPVDCIYEAEDQLMIHPNKCINYKTYKPKYPMSAIYPEEDVPENLKAYIAKNRDSFSSPTPPGRPQR
ncbi:MAG TPA: ferredoxin [Gemmatimonadales bacterium]|nr:ferredoxin [Gemmatimonadales bacterium]